MKSLSHSLKFFVAAMFTLALCAAAQAQVNTFMDAEDGNDANPCTRTAPCLTLAGTLAKTAARGQITALASGNYGPATIDKAITIDGKGTVASTVVAAGNGLTVNAGAGDTVIIRNYTINGNDTGNIGLNYIGARSQLVLQNVTIERFDNGFFSKGTSSAGPLRAEINKSSFEGNRVGLELEANTLTALRDSVITGTLHKGGPSLSFGINMQPAFGTFASLKIESNEISYCQSGLRAVGNDVGGGNPLWWGRNNHIYGNTIGINMTANVIYHSNNTNALSENQFDFFGGINAGLPQL